MSLLLPCYLLNQKAKYRDDDVIIKTETNKDFAYRNTSIYCLMRNQF